LTRTHVRRYEPCRCDLLACRRQHMQRDRSCATRSRNSVNFMSVPQRPRPWDSWASPINRVALCRSLRGRREEKVRSKSQPATAGSIWFLVPKTNFATPGRPDSCRSFRAWFVMPATGWVSLFGPVSTLLSGAGVVLSREPAAGEQGIPLGGELRLCVRRE
jgi:hypothetical protein